MKDAKGHGSDPRGATSAHASGVAKIGQPDPELARCLFQSFAAVSGKSPEQVAQAFKNAGDNLKGTNYDLYPKVAAELGIKLTPARPPNMTNLGEGMKTFQNNTGDKYLLLAKYAVYPTAAGLGLGHIVAVDGKRVVDTAKGQVNNANLDMMWSVKRRSPPSYLSSWRQKADK